MTILKELLLASTILSNYARVVYTPFMSPTYGADTIDNGILLDIVGRIEQASVGSSGTVSSAGIELAQLSLTGAGPALPAAAGCTDSPVFLGTQGQAGTFTNTFSSACGHMAVQVWGAAYCGNGGGTKGPYRGAGFGQKNGVVLSPGKQFAYYIGDGGSSFSDPTSPCERYNQFYAFTWFCQTTANCGSFSASGVIARGTAGYNAPGYANIGDTVANGGGVGSSSGVHLGGGGGAGGPHGPGASGLNANITTGGTGGQGDNATGGTGGLGGTLAVGTAGGAGVNIVCGGTTIGSGGGGGGGDTTHNGGKGGALGGGPGGGAAGSIDGGAGGICLIPST